MDLKEASIPPAEERSGHEDPDALVRLQGVSVDFRLGGSLFTRTPRTLRAVDDVSLSIGRGHTMGLVGGTGSGKSTIAHLLMGMVQPNAGSVTIGGRELSSLRRGELAAHRRGVQVVLQDPYSSLDPRMKVGDIIAEPLTLGRRVGGSKAIKERVAELLRLVGLSPAKAALYPHQFSGGQRQRIAIARALAPRPDLIVLDEPTSALDVSVRAQILTLLHGLQVELGVTYLVISHDLVSVAYLASTVAVMYLGRIVEIGPTRAVYQSPRHPYTLLLLNSAPGADGAFLDPVRTDAIAPRGAASEPMPVGGCRYYSRCGLRVRLGSPARCRDEDPQLREQEVPGHAAACHFAERTPELIPGGLAQAGEWIARPGGPVQPSPQAAS